jgi:hypothetical protein
MKSLQTHSLYDIYPKVIRAHHPAVIHIHPQHETNHFTEDSHWSVSIYPTEELGSHENPKILPGQPVNGDLLVEYTFGDEQEYQIIITQLIGAENNLVVEFSIYTLAGDLYGQRPYKGDFHQHSNRSDGQEPPAYVAAASRRIGIDFTAVTDHRRYAPSLEAIQAFADLPIDLRLYPGEEIHPPDNTVHMINFGANISINDLFLDESAYRAEVKIIEDSLADMPAGLLRYQYASCIWCYQKIRSAGGLAIFCHPYWVHNHSYNVPETLIARHLHDLPFDAFELIGGYFPNEVESNFLQVARYYEERSQGRLIPIVGSSDSHGCENGSLFGWYYSIVFTPSTDLVNIIQSIKELNSVAIECLPGATPRAHGPYRLVKYAQFLLREVLPLHDALCAEEGRLMIAYLNGSQQAVEALRACQGEIAALYTHLWG